MKVICIACQKGGAGKTTLATNLGVEAERLGQRVALIELDNQGSLSRWASRRDAETPAYAVIERGDDLSAVLEGIGEDGYSLAIIDTPGVDSPHVDNAIAIADFVLIPSRPSALDLEATRPTIEAARRHKRNFGFVLTQAPARSSRTHSAGMGLSAVGLLAPVAVTYRMEYQDAAAAGSSVVEAGSEKSAQEIATLWKWIYERL